MSQPDDLTAVLNLQNVVFHFQADKPLICGASVTLRSRELRVLMGPSGSGKSTLLRLASGQLTPLAGTVFRKAQRLGFVFQRNALFDSLSVQENLLFPLRGLYKIIPSSSWISRVDQVLDQVGLLASKNKFPGELSGGMQKRLALARALVTEPDLLLCDDPTAGLDPVTGAQIIDLLIQLQKSNSMAVWMVTNELNRALQLCQGDRRQIDDLRKLQHELPLSSESLQGRFP